MARNRGLAGTHERAHDPAPDLAREHIRIESGPRQHGPRILELVDPRRLDTDPLESGLRQEPAVVGLLQGAGDAPYPQLHATPHGIRDFPSRSEERRVGKECRSRWSPYH